jgi:hypothetical protein
MDPVLGVGNDGEGATAAHLQGQLGHGCAAPASAPPSGKRDLSGRHGDSMQARDGRLALTCPVSVGPVPRIVKVGKETSYCARCQTGGTMLVDCALSKLPKASWPKSIDDL